MNKAASWKATLRARPCRNQAARESKEPGDVVAVYVKNLRPRYRIPPISWIVPFKPERRFVLDGIGTYIWKLCDGSRTMEELVDSFAERHQLSFHEARVAMTHYLQSLVQRGIIAMIIPQEITETES